MGFLTTAAKEAYRFIRYGAKLGKTAPNGTKVYKRFGKTTAINNAGKITRQTTRVKTAPFTTRTEAVDYLPFGETKKSTSILIRDGNNFKYGDRIWTDTKGETHWNSWDCSNEGKIKILKGCLG